MAEQWRFVKGYKPLYAVSSWGRVRNAVTGKILFPGISDHWYPIVVLCKKGVAKTHKIHRLVLEAFLPKRPRGSVANHLNGNKNDARLENLEWCTQSENNLHAYRTGLRTVTEKQRGFGIRRNPTGINQWTKRRTKNGNG